MSGSLDKVENDAFREAAAIGWDAAVAALKYEDGSPVEVVTMTNPYRVATPAKRHLSGCILDTDHGAGCVRQQWATDDPDAPWNQGTSPAPSKEARDE